MEENCVLSNFLNKLYTWLIGHEPTCYTDTRIFRTHNNQLRTSGDLSFPLNLSGWKKQMRSTSNTVKILQYIYKFEKNELKESDFDDLIEEVKCWNIIRIDKIALNKSKVNIFLNQESAFKIIITKILSEKKHYGCCVLKSVRVEIKDTSESDLSALRLSLLKKFIENIFKTSSSANNSSEIIYLTNRSSVTNRNITCGVVITNKYGKKNTNITSEQFYLKRTADMQLMAMHKYGVRVNSEPGWQEFFKQLGNAAVTIDLLHVKPNRPIIINEDCAAGTSSKGASFILYNCARMAEIFKKFDKKVKDGEMVDLPNIDQVDFALLNQSEEWELLFVFLMQYGTVVESCVRDIEDRRLNTHNLCVFLDSLCSTFSIYYRRVRVLTESRPHLLPVMFARMYLLQAIQQVIHNALALLDIAPIKQM